MKRLKGRQAYHDSRRYLKKHPPRLSDPLFELSSERTWGKAVDRAIRNYPKNKKRQEERARNDYFRSGRRGRSAEDCVTFCEDAKVSAVEAAYRMSKNGDKKQFRKWVALYLGYGREKYDKTGGSHR